MEVTGRRYEASKPAVGTCWKRICEVVPKRGGTNVEEKGKEDFM